MEINVFIPMIKMGIYYQKQILMEIKLFIPTMIKEINYQKQLLIDSVIVGHSFTQINHSQ